MTAAPTETRQHNAPDGHEVSQVELERRQYRVHQQIQSTITSLISTIVFVVVIVIGLKLSPGWPRVKETFFSGEYFVKSFPHVLDGLWLNIRVLLVAVVGVAILSTLIALVRIEMIFNPLGLKFEVFDNRASYNEIAAAADGRPVIFDGSYTDAAKYGFYTGRTAYAQPSIRYRTSQYELKDDDDRMAGKPAILQVWDSVPGKRRLKLSNGKRFEYIETEHFTPVRRIDVAYDALPGQVAAGDTLHLRLTLHNPYPYEYRIDGDSVSVSIVWRNRSEPTHRYKLPITGTLPPHGEMQGSADFVVPALTPRTFQVGFTIANLPVTSWFNGKTVKINLKK